MFLCFAKAFLEIHDMAAFMNRFLVTAGADLGAHGQIVPRGAGAHDGVGPGRRAGEVAGGAGEPLLMMGGMGEVFHFRGMTRPAESVAAAQTEPLAVDFVAVETTDVLLAVPAQRPFPVSAFVARPAHVRGNGDRHFIGGMSLPLGPMAGLARHAFVVKILCAIFPPRGVARQTFRFGPIGFPEFLEHLRGEGLGMKGRFPFQVFLRMTSGARLRSGILGLRRRGKKYQKSR